MSKSLRVQNGDLVVGSGRALEAVSGANKLAQDLRLHILEKIGIDPATPSFGSRLDGGVIGAQSVPSMLGEMATQEKVNEIRAEVISVLNNFQKMQLDKIRSEMISYGGKHTLTASEILASIDSVKTRAVGSTVIVGVTCMTMDQLTFNLTFAVQA